MDNKSIEILLRVNEPSFQIGDIQYSVCYPGKGFCTHDSTGKNFEYPDLESLLNNWIVGGKPFKDIVQSTM